MMVCGSLSLFKAFNGASRKAFCWVFSFTGLRSRECGTTVFPTFSSNLPLTSTEEIFKRNVKKYQRSRIIALVVLCERS